MQLFITSYIFIFNLSFRLILNILIICVFLQVFLLFYTLII